MVEGQLRMELQMKRVMLVALTLALVGAAQSDTSRRDPRRPGASDRESTIKGILDEVGSLAKNEEKILGELKENLTVKRAIERDYQALEQDKQGYTSELQRAEKYCSGIFSEPEFSRRKASCAATRQELHERREVLVQREAGIDSRENSRQAQARALADREKALQERARVLHLRLAEIKGMEACNRECVSMASLEDLHQCMQSCWDGARKRNYNDDPNVVKP